MICYQVHLYEQSPRVLPTRTHFSHNLSFCFPARTRTKDKYRVVYSDHQRLELEKEFHYSRYITIRCLSRVFTSLQNILFNIFLLRRKAELAQALNLTERQVGWVRSATIKREACLTKENPHRAKRSNVSKQFLMNMIIRTSLFHMKSS